MRIIRSLVVAFLAVAIAMLPASMGVAMATPSTSAVTVVAQAIPDCEHYLHQHHAPVKQTQKTLYHSACITGCALCFGFVGADNSAIAYVITTSATLKLLRPRENISSLMGSPPFLPPRA